MAIQKNFHRLIRRQRQKSTEPSAIRQQGELCLDPALQVEGWAQHFQDLATPRMDGMYDDVYLRTVEESVDLISMEARHLYLSSPLVLSEVEDAIDNLNTGKAADEWSIVAEHLKTAKLSLAHPLLLLLNSIRRHSFVPDCLKSGVITPIAKKDKSTLIMDNYRGITITAVLGKILELILLNRKLESQSSLQFGFTKGLSPGMAALLLTETSAEAKSLEQPLFICTLDAVKAFDTVNHAALLRRLYLEDIDLESWSTIKSLYEDGSAKVKWKGLISSPVRIQQGVRQGGVLSPTLYKSYINNLLTTMEQDGLGMYIGPTFVGTPTVADDVLLMAASPLDLQLMLSSAELYARRERYQLHPQKSTIIQLCKSKPVSSFPWQLAGSVVTPVEQATHLGIVHQGVLVREHTHAHWIRDKIKRTRGTVYGLIGTGLHGTNGLDAYTCVKIYQAYALPKLLYGLEVVDVNIGQLAALESFHLGTLKKISSLPDRTATEAVFLMLGILPIKPLIHISRLTLIGAIARSDNSTLHEIAIRQCAVKSLQSVSWFKDTELLLLQYSLPNTLELFSSPPTKYRWKVLVKKAVNTFWRDLMICDASENKSSVRFMNLNCTNFGSCHPCWRFVTPYLKDVRRAIVKAKMLTGTYPTQENLSRYSKNNLSANCPMCKSANEDVSHMLLECPATFEARSVEHNNIANLTASNCGLDTWKLISESPVDLLQLILDATALMDRGVISNAPGLLQALEWHSRRLCFSVHCRRAHLLDVEEFG